MKKFTVSYAVGVSSPALDVFTSDDLSEACYFAIQMKRGANVPDAKVFLREGIDIKLIWS